MEAKKGQSKNILQIQKNIQNRYVLEKSLLKSCQIEKTIWNPGLIHRLTNNFRENRK